MHQDGATSPYLNLMKQCLTNWIYGDTEVEFITPKGYLRRKAIHLLLPRKAQVARSKPFDPAMRAEGRDCEPRVAHTMIGLKRLDNLQFCVEEVLKNSVPGDLIETGVWRGGAVIFMRAILKAYGVKDRCVWCADSFEGLPPPNPEKYPLDAGDRHYLSKSFPVSLDQVKSNFERYGLLDDQVRFLKGWFRDTLPNAPIKQLAVVRLDGDLYESTRDALTDLYPKLSVGGYLIVDDYGTNRACAQAVHDYRNLHEIKEEIVPIDWAGIYWQRSK